MKKMFFFALAAAGMLTACSNDDTLGGNGDQNVSEQQIRLGVASSKVQTRGTGTVGGMTDAENVWAGQTLWVYMLQKGSMDLAYYKVTAVGTIAAAETEVFNNKKFNAPNAADNTKSGLATTADGTIAYYPVSGNYDFWGYRVDDAVAGDPVVKLVNDAGDEVAADQATKRVVDIKIDGSQDIMAGKAAPSTDEVAKLGNYADNFYSAYAARKGVQPNITFNHLLTRFTFEVRAGSKATAGLPTAGNTDAVKVNGVSVDSKTTGTLTVAYTGETKAAADLLTFTGDASALTLKQRDAALADNNAPLVALEPVSLTWTDDAATIGDVIKVGEALLVAPGQTEYPLTIALSQDVLQKVGETKVTMPLEQKATIKMDGVKAFEPGKSYKVTITVYGLEEIKVTATLVPWVDGGSIDIDDDRNPNEGEYTEPTPATPEPIEP